MKMPTRPWYPADLPPDIFGLHQLGLLSLASESAEERARRVAKVEAGIREAFEAATHHLGEDRARALFKQVARRPGRGVGKVHASDRDQRLLRAYDESRPNSEPVAALARRLKTASGNELGNTADAIEAQIRKLVREREKRTRAAKFEARRWRMAMRNEPLSLLSLATSEK